MRNYAEAAIQRQIVEYLAWALAPPAFFTAFPAGGHVGYLAGARQRGTGLKAGMPDLQIFYDGVCYHIEVKGPKGTLSAAQRETHSALKAAGCPVAIARSIDDVQTLLRGAWWPIPTRETKPTPVTALAKQLKATTPRIC